MNNNKFDALLDTVSGDVICLECMEGDEKLIGRIVEHNPDVIRIGPGLKNEEYSELLQDGVWCDQCNKQVLPKTPKKSTTTIVASWTVHRVALSSDIIIHTTLTSLGGKTVVIDALNKEPDYLVAYAYTADEARKNHLAWVEKLLALDGYNALKLAEQAHDDSAEEAARWIKA
jgi:hypothetical protein